MGVGVGAELTNQVSKLLSDWNKGDPQAREELMPLVYNELRKLAAAHLRRERDDHTLQPTALVHEVYLRLLDQRNVQWQDKTHFFGVAAQMMRRILVDHARGHVADKRGGGLPKVPLNEAIAMSRERPAEMLALDDSLKRLASNDPQQARIVELRVFVGLTIEQTAQAMDISPATVKRDWNLAKAWLLREIDKAEVS